MSGDEVIDPEVELAELAIEKMCTGPTCSMPPIQKVQLKVGYDDGFLQAVGGSSYKAQDYIDKAFTHVQAMFCHPTLGTKVVVERLGSAKYYAGHNWQATERKLEEMYQTTEQELGSADLMFYIGFDDTGRDNTVGIAFTSAVCAQGDNFKQSINEYRSKFSSAGYVSCVCFSNESFFFAVQAY